MSGFDLYAYYKIKTDMKCDFMTRDGTLTFLYYSNVECIHTMNRSWFVVTKYGLQQNIRGVKSAHLWSWILRKNTPCLKDLIWPYSECIVEIEKLLNTEKLFTYGKAFKWMVCVGFDLVSASNNILYILRNFNALEAGRTYILHRNIF
jgi:hypothetical protein